MQKLRKFHDSCESNIRALKTLGVQTDSCGSLLIQILLKKLPEQLRCTILRTNPLADCSLNDLRTALCHEIDTREYLTGLREQHSSQKNKNISGERVARGTVVLIHDETPRNQWKLGVIIQLQYIRGRITRVSVHFHVQRRAFSCPSCVLNGSTLSNFLCVLSWYFTGD